MPKRLKMAEAAFRILSHQGEPMHYEEITRIAIRKHLIDPRGKTPEMSMLSVFNRDHRFQRVDKGLYGLLEWQGIEKTSSGKRTIGFNNRTLAEISRILKESERPLHYVEVTLLLMKKFQASTDKPELVVKALMQKADNIAGNQKGFYGILPFS